MMMKKIFKIILCGFLGMGQVAWADLYDVNGIPIVAEMKSAQEARTVAINNGQKEAFWALMNKMIDPDEIDRISLPSDDVIQNMVQNVSLADEKTTATKYMASLNVRFHPERVQMFLQNEHIPFLTKEMPKTLIVPVFLSGDDTYLLDEHNPVYSFFKKRSDSLTNNSVLPMGDLEEVIQAQEIWASGRVEDFKIFANKYNTDRVLLISVIQRGPYLTTQTKSVPPFEALPEQTIESIDAMGNTERAMVDIWHQIMTAQEREWWAAHTNDFSAPNLVWIKIPVHTLKDWIVLRKKLEKESIFNSLNIRGFKPNEVIITVSSRETIENIEARLKLMGYMLGETDVGGLWELQAFIPSKGDYENVSD